jgi:hypothetical protein
MYDRQRKMDVVKVLFMILFVFSFSQHNKFVFLCKYLGEHKLLGILPCQMIRQP